MLAEAHNESGVSSDVAFLFIGVAITFGIAAIGYIVSASRESRRWKREKRLELYLSLIETNTKFQRSVNQLGEHYETYKKLKDSSDPSERRKADTAMDAVSREKKSCLALLPVLFNDMSVAKMMLQKLVFQKLKTYSNSLVDLLQKLVDGTNNVEDTAKLQEVKRRTVGHWEDFLVTAGIDLGFTKVEK